MEFSLTTLGTASAKPIVDKYSSAHVFNIRGRLFLVDCGEGTQVQLLRNHISLLKIDNLLISHLHGDHVFGIFGLLSTMGLFGRTAPLHIYAPRDFSSIANFFRGHFGEGIKYEIVHHSLSCREPELICDTRTADVYAFPLNHGIDTFGFLFREKWPPDWQTGLPQRNSRSAAYCSDTAPFEKEAEWVQGVDLLYHEATYTDEFREVANSRFHSTARQAAEVALKAGAGQLVLGHFSSRYKDLSVISDEARAVFPSVCLAGENERFQIPVPERN